MKGAQLSRKTVGGRNLVEGAEFKRNFLVTDEAKFITSLDNICAIDANHVEMR